MKTPIPFWIMPLLAGVLLSAGCSTTSTVVHGDGTETRIMFNDPVTQKRVQIVDVVDTRKNGLMHAVVTMENLTKRNLRVQYRFRWFDANGAPLMPANDVYLTQLLEGKETAAVQSMAPTPEAVSFRFQVTKANVLERGPDSF
jgi:uncharacterized protein YcfL